MTPTLTGGGLFLCGDTFYQRFSQFLHISRFSLAYTLAICIMETVKRERNKPHPQDGNL